MRLDDDFENETPEEFSSLKDCVDYYGDVLSVINKSYSLGFYSRREFKAVKRIVIRQQNASLRMVKKIGKHQRAEETNKLKPSKNVDNKQSTNKSLPSSSKNVRTIEQNNQQYQIEDKDGNKIDGQMDVEDLNEGDVYEKEE